MNLRSISYSKKQYFQCATFLLFSYVLIFGWLLASTDFLPYVMDNNESFSSLWHAYNIYHFDFLRSAGLADESFAFHDAAHAYAHTHQGNFPRLFAFLIFSLGANTIESQLVITTFTVGVAAIFMAYHFFSKIANPLFALVCCLLLITDYVLVAQWQVVTYRVWHEFFVFSSMLCVHRMVEGRRFWSAITVLNFACLFYYELIFVAFVSLASALYAAYLCRNEPKIVLRFWAAQAVGGIIALSILALQLYFYLGWEDLKMDAYLTFVARNHYQDSAALLERMREFFDSRNIVFWYNLEDGSRFRTIGYFFASLLFYEFQIHTPFLSTLCLIALLAFLSVLVFRAISIRDNSNNLRRVGLMFGDARQLIGSVPVRGGLYLGFIHLFHKFYRGDFGDLQRLELVAMVVAIVIGVVVVEFLPRFRGSDRSEVLRKAPCLLALALLSFNIPSIYGHVSSEPIFMDQYSTFFLGYILIFVFFSAWVLWKYQSVGKANHNFRWNVYFYNFENIAVTLFSFLSFLGFFVALLGKNLILGIPDQTRLWFEAVSFGHFNTALFMATCATALLHYICSTSITDDQSSPGVEKSRLNTKLKVSIFVLLTTLLIAGSWKLYNPDYEQLWLEMANATLPGPSVYIVTTLAMMLGCGAVIAKRGVFSDLGIIPTLKGCGVFILTGLFAYIAVYMLSPGYIFSGYRFRLVPFTTFHTVTLMAAPAYVLLVVGLRYLAPYWMRLTKAGFALSGAVHERSGHRGLVLRGVTGVASLATLVIICIYWAGVQLFYIRLIPPDHYSFLNKLSKQPYVGQSFVVNTYAAPIAAKTGAWAYLEAKLMFPALVKNGGKYEIPFDTTYLWFADKRTNPDYAHPAYFLCVKVQSTSTVIEELQKRKGLGVGNAGCEANQLVQLARRGEGKTVYPALELSEVDEEGPKIVGYERWAIVKLNWAK